MVTSLEWKNNPQFVPPNETSGFHVRGEGKKKKRSVKPDLGVQRRKAKHKVLLLKRRRFERKARRKHSELLGEGDNDRRYLCEKGGGFSEGESEL